MAKGFILCFIFLYLNIDNVRAQQIILSSRTFHPNTHIDTLSTLKAVRVFKAERLDWLYCGNKEQIDLLKELHVPYSLAINPQIPDSIGFTTVSTRIINIKGKPYVAPWMSEWDIKNPYWGCVNNPRFKDIFNKRSKQLVDNGAYGIFVDDARFNDQVMDWGGCFCKYCKQGFLDFLRSEKHLNLASFNFSTIKVGSEFYLDYRRFQRQSVIAFLSEWKITVLKYSRSSLTFLTNNGGGNWSDIYKIFDVGIAEISASTGSYLEVDRAILKASLLKKKQIFTYASSDQNENISFYMYCFFKRSEAVIPWDSYLNGDSKAKPSRFYIEADSIMQYIEFIKNIRNDFMSSEPVSYKSLPIIASKDAIVHCLKLKDGTIYLLAVSPLRYSRELTLEVSPQFNTTQLLSKSKVLEMDNKGYKIFKGNLIILKIERR